MVKEYPEKRRGKAGRLEGGRLEGPRGHMMAGFRAHKQRGEENRVKRQMSHENNQRLSTWKKLSPQVPPGTAPCSDTPDTPVQFRNLMLHFGVALVVVCTLAMTAWRVPGQGHGFHPGQALRREEEGGVGEESVVRGPFDAQAVTGVGNVWD